MPATIYYDYAKHHHFDADDVRKLKPIEKSYAHGPNAGFGHTQSSNLVRWPCPACSASVSLEFCEDDDCSPFIVDIDARGTFSCHTCNSVFVDAEFYRDTPVEEYPVPFDAGTVDRLLFRLQKNLVIALQPIDVSTDLVEMKNAEVTVPSIYNYLVRCFRHQDNSQGVSMLLYLAEQLDARVINADMFMQSLRTLLLPSINNSALDSLPDNLAGVE